MVIDLLGIEAVGADRQGDGRGERRRRAAIEDLAASHKAAVLEHVGLADASRESGVALGHLLPLYDSDEILSMALTSFDELLAVPDEDARSLATLPLRRDSGPFQAPVLARSAP
ncbi:hypothetical protein [Streptomyces sp. NBC_00401]|uniref:hypothetical protein n=1 Tax=Streptomyces sp. NBC_00401 TaxID=2975738 RepID=UPI00224DDD7D|nr:hypothetical protein [Streptomyces sp. NBC_00401]MCX5085696.1 hypothetical protein [Streptomyces sp. NBC_00401]